MKPEDTPIVGKLADNLMLSGGAKGADCYWAKAASAAGHQVIHWSFEGHKSYDPDNTLILDDETLKEADIRLEMAKLSMKRSIPYHKPWIANLLRRNWFQVQYAESVYAVGTLNDKAVFASENLPLSRKPHVDRMGVNGGTAWACQMYFDRWVEESNKLCSAFTFNLDFFDQEKNLLYTFRPFSKDWIAVSMVMGPPKGIYAAIGTRDLNDHGKAFIDRLFSR